MTILTGWLSKQPLLGGNLIWMLLFDHVIRVLMSEAHPRISFFLFLALANCVLSVFRIASCLCVTRGKRIFLNWGKSSMMNLFALCLLVVCTALHINHRHVHIWAIFLVVCWLGSFYFVSSLVASHFHLDSCVTLVVSYLSGSDHFAVLQQILFNALR